MTVSRHPDPAKNAIQTRFAKRGEEESPHLDVAGFEWKPGVPVTLRIERLGESSDTRIRILVDGFPVLEEEPMANLGKTTMEVKIGVFAEGQTGRKVEVDVDDVEIVHREKRK